MSAVVVAGRLPAVCVVLLALLAAPAAAQIEDLEDPTQQGAGLALVEETPVDQVEASGVRTSSAIRTPP